MEKDLLEDMVHSEDSADQAHTEAADRTDRRRKKTFICAPPPTTYAADTIRKRSMYWPESGKGVPSGIFYSASANSGLGNNVTALEQAKEAVRLDPGNMQYQMLLDRLQNGGTWYQQRQMSFGYPGTFDTSCCVKLCVANMLCNLCCGGSGLCCGGYGGGYYI